MSMTSARTNRDIEDGKRISALFTTISEQGKMMAIAYLSALRDKEVADSRREGGRSKATRG